MQIKDTKQGKAYCLTVKTAPCVVSCIDKNGVVYTILNASAPGQYIFISPFWQITIDKDDALLTQSFNQASISSAANTGDGGLKPEIVQTLPVVGLPGIIYFVPKQLPSQEVDYYDEYIWINNKFEYIGSTQVTETTIDNVGGDILLSDGITIDPDTKTLGLGDIQVDSVNTSSGKFLAPLKNEESSIFIGDYTDSTNPENYKKGYLVIRTNSNGLNALIDYFAYDSMGNSVTGNNIVFGTNYLACKHIQCNQLSQIYGNVTNTLNGSSIFGNVCTFNGAVIANAGLTNTTGEITSFSKLQKFGNYIASPNGADAGKNWLEIENTSPSGIDISLSAKYVTSTGGIGLGQLRAKSALICDGLILGFGAADLRSTLKVGGNFTLNSSTMITPLETTPTRIGNFVSNPTEADVGKLWVELSKKNGYIEIAGKEVVNNAGAISIENYPVQFA